MARAIVLAHGPLPGPVRVLPRQAVLLARRADDALRVLVHARAVVLLRGVLVLRLDVAAADLDGVELVPADAAVEDLLPSGLGVEAPLARPSRRSGSAAASPRSRRSGWRRSVLRDPGRRESSRGPARRRRRIWFLSCTGSSVTTRSTPSGPRICLQGRTSNCSAARISASAAASGVANVVCCRRGRLEPRPCARTEPDSSAQRPRRAPRRAATVRTVSRSSCAHLRRPPPPPPPPPPRDPMLEEPRELLARALLPL